MPAQDDFTRPNQLVAFDPAWTLEQTQQAIRAEERRFQFEGGRIGAAELLSFSVDAALTGNVGTFEEDAGAPARAVVLVDGIPADREDRATMFESLGRRGLELICFSDVLVQGTLTEVAVCRAISDRAAPAAPEFDPRLPILPALPVDRDIPVPPVAPVPAPVIVVGPATPAAGLISQEAFDLILKFEGLDQPGRWPGASSGISLGVGYDLGHVSAGQFREDWSPHLTQSQLARLTRAIGLQGPSAKQEAPRFADIKVSRSAGMEVFNRCTLPRFSRETRRAFPGVERLPLNAQGALISLVFNRGADMDGPRRREMAAIREIVKNGDFAADLGGILSRIAGQIRSMKRLWNIEELAGLHRRRDAEATLVVESAVTAGAPIPIATTAPATSPADPVAPPPVTTDLLAAQALAALALAHCNVGEKYRLGAFVPKNKRDARGPWDCAEFVSWCVYQTGGFLVGCEDNDGDPATADAWTGHWKRDARTHGRLIPVDEAARIPGAVLLRYPPQTGTGHIALSDGRGGTYEAKGTPFGVVTDQIAGRRWDTGILLHGIAYDTPGDAIAMGLPPRVYFVGAAGMDRAIVAAIQEKLRDAGFDPGPIDGDYGDRTADAVLAYQAQKQLLADGEVGPQTAKALAVALA